MLSIRQESQTWDEGIYLGAGYSYWKTGDFRINPQSAPLDKLIVALPLLPLDLDVPVGDPSWKTRDEVGFGNRFLYDNRLPADTILFLGRSTTIAITAILAIALALWVRRRAGNVAALVALLLFAFDPTVIAHGRYTTADLCVALFTFLAVVAWDSALERGKTGRFALAGVLLAAAFASKYSAVFLVPVFVILALLRTRNVRSLAIGVPVAVLCAIATLFVLARGNLGFYVFGMQWTLDHGKGELSYLFGLESTTGWWWYFPAAFVVKTPIGALVLMAAAAIAGARHWKKLGDLLVALVPIAVFGITCLFYHADLGIRYLLPIYPFIYAAVGILAVRYVRKELVVACIALVAIESAWIYPNYLAFFNVAVGGPSAGPRYLLDSNIDWGQDLKKLGWWLRDRGERGACIAYFGNASMPYYGIESAFVPEYANVAGRRNLRCYVAVSATYLYGKGFIGGDRLRWLRDLTPVAKIGYSIYVYDLRAGDPSAR